MGSRIFLRGGGDLDMKLRDKQAELLKKHEAVFYVLVNVSNQMIRQEQLTKILIDSHYKTNAVGVTRLLKELEDAKLLKREQFEREKTKVVVACKPAIRYILGDKVANIKLETNSEIRQVRNYIKTELFYEQYVRATDSLSSAVSKVKSSSNTLFNSTEQAYRALNSEKVSNLFKRSFTKESTIFNQYDEFNDLKRQRSEHVKKTAHTREKQGFEYEFERNLTTFEDLKAREIYLTKISLKNATKEEIEHWRLNFLDNKKASKLVLVLDFKIVVANLSPRNKNIGEKVLYLNKFIRETFKGVEQNTEEVQMVIKTMVNIDIVCANQSSLERLKLSRIMKIVNKFNRVNGFYDGRGYSTKFKIHLKHKDYRSYTYKRASE